MERVQRIVSHEMFQKEYDRLQELERERRFCRHDLEHFMAVARIAYIMVLEQELKVNQDIIYGIALLHDLGRARYEDTKKHHEEVSAMMAEDILPDCGYTNEEIDEMTKVILAHRGETENKGLAHLFYQADKLSRDCVHCQARQDCYWPEEKKNHSYQY